MLYKKCQIIVLIPIFLFRVVTSFAQQRDSRVREYLSPIRIVWQQESQLIQGAEYLLRSGHGQANLVNNELCKLSSTGQQHPAILFDFGKELQGGLQIVTGMPASHAPVTIRVRLGESVSEAMCDIDEVNGATNDHAMRDFVIRVPWLGVLEVGNSGFRFARIDLLDDSAELHLKEIRAISVYQDIPYKGSFRCNDERLNRIWQTGAYTVHLNMQEYIWDGIKRDRLVWIGDLHPEVMTVNTVFGYNEVIPKSIDLIRDSTPLPRWMTMCTYSLWWILIQRDWYLYQGNLDYLKEQKSYLCDLLQLIMTRIGEDGLEKFNDDEGRFLDWPSCENPLAINAGVQALVIQAMKAGYELCSVLGEDMLATKCEAVRRKMVNAAPKIIKPFLKSGMAPDAPGQKQAASLLALTGLISPKEANQKYLSVNGGHGFSTFYGYYMLQAMAAAGNYQGAIDVIRQYWGAMIDLGATTFWEDFNLDWLPDASRIDELVATGKKDIHRDYGDHCYKGFRHSLCHGWSSGPTSWLSEHVLGVQVVEPGCRVVRITPHLGDLEWVEGTFPTPYGQIVIRHEKGADAKVRSRIDAPSEVKVLQ